MNSREFTTWSVGVDGVVKYISKAYLVHGLHPLVFSQAVYMADHAERILDQPGYEGKGCKTNGMEHNRM